MAEALILDAEALNALARPDERKVLFERARAILLVAHERKSLIRVPAPVLAELYRGSHFDAPLDHLLKSRGIVICDLTPKIARSAGGLLAKAKRSSAHAIDAFVVATALTFDKAVITTGDSDDIKILAAGSRRITILAL